MIIINLPNFYFYFYFSIFLICFIFFFYFLFRFIKFKTINDEKRRFNSFIAHSHILLYFNKNVKHLKYHLLKLNEDDLNHIILHEGEKIIKQLNLLQLNGLMNDLNTYLSEYYRKDFKNLRKLNRLNKKIRKKELKYYKKKKNTFSKNFYLAYFEVRKLKRKYNKHKFFDIQKKKVSYKEAKI